MEFQEFFYSLLICFFLSFLIGIERQYNKRIIGLRTTILVSLGAFLFVNFSFSVGAEDISRIASTVVTGIGFLGAGVILKDGRKVRGLTTAATLWCDAAIGTLCAGGALREAILGTIILLFANTFLREINKVINRISDNKHLYYSYLLTIKGENAHLLKIKKYLIEECNAKGIDVKSLNFKKQGGNGTLSSSFLLTKDQLSQVQELIDKIYHDYQITKLNFNKVGELKAEEYDEEI